MERHNSERAVAYAANIKIKRNKKKKGFER